MGHDMVTESRFGGSWVSSRKSSSSSSSSSGDKVLGILVFEVTSLMCKVVSLWHSLDDEEMLKLREEMANSTGIRRLVSDDQDYLMELALNEVMENFGNLATSVARLGKKCTDPVYHRFEYFIRDPIMNKFEWLGWEYRLKKMDWKVKKMERFVAVTMQLARELEVLEEHERTLRRMRRNAGWDQLKLLECQKKVMLHRKEVKSLREMSPWVRTYDYVVRILLRSLLTVLQRINHLFRTNLMVSVDDNNGFDSISSARLSRSSSFSPLLLSSVHPSDNHLCSFNSEHLGKLPHSKTKQSSHVGIGPFKWCVSTGSNSPIFNSCKPTGTRSFRFIGAYDIKIDKLNDSKMGSLSGRDKIYSKLSVFDTKRLLDAPTSTLGDAALSLRYANIIILIEKLVSAPHMIGLDTRDALYNMLPSTMRNALRVKLKSGAKTTLASFICSASLAEERRMALVRILEWLAPLSHNTVRWMYERSFEEQHLVSRSNVLLVQTLHFANLAKIEAAITELLVGLTHLCRIGKAHK